METERKLGSELLRVNGLGSGEMIAEERQKLDALLQRERRLNRFLFRFSIGALVTGVCAFMLTAALLDSGQDREVLNIFVVGCMLAWIGAFLLALVRERSISRTELNIRLANIEMLLRKDKEE